MTRISVGIMAALLLLYLVLVAQLALRFLAVDEPIAKVMGVALFVLPLVGFWALIVEWIFGVRSERLGRRLAAEGLAPMTELPRLPSGRIERAAADEAFPKFQAEVEATPDSWQAWYRLGLAYDACGDRRRARRALGHAIGLSRTQVAP